MRAVAPGRSGACDLLGGLLTIVAEPVKGLLIMGSGSRQGFRGVFEQRNA